MKLLTLKNILQEPKYLAIVAGIFLLGAVLACGSYILALDQVSLIVDGETLTFKTRSNSVAQVLEEKGVFLEEGDIVKPDLDHKISENLQIEVFRAFPVTIQVGPESTQVKTIEQPVRDVLGQAGILVTQDDIVKPGLDELVTANQKIEIIKVTSQTVVKRDILKAVTEYRRTKELEKGKQVVIREGQNGLVERRYKVVYENGVEKKRFLMTEKVIEPKINTIIAVGIKPIVRMLETSRGSLRYTDVKVMDATAYSPGPESCGKYAKYGRTYTGKKAGFGVVAVDPKVIRLGTKLYIEGYGVAEAADIGGAIKGNRIDLCFETYREAILYGRKKVRVYILE
ncbi:MAG TPA: 3D domain-containing protein [Bacillota bacterium]|jgi:uncharacterized protein YabE (DUF348 family)|nr:3D domain-containing protein [Bacillota bacterium]HOL10187.1 3D domain-containing protein [Bacillota bacterium]HPO97939.1 3D domain-containing protein [Bacillota bacterium]